MPQFVIRRVTEDVMAAMEALQREDLEILDFNGKTYMVESKDVPDLNPRLWVVSQEAVTPPPNTRRRIHGPEESNS